MVDDPYQRSEWAIMADPTSPMHITPPWRDARSILDVGCGTGQTLAWAPPEARLAGVDYDASLIDQAKRILPPSVDLRCCPAEALPAEWSERFDLTYSRVALPYTQFSRSLPELYRVTKPGGRIWITVHSWENEVKKLRALLGTSNLKALIYRAYVLANGLLFHLTGKQVSFFGRRYESFQTVSSLRRAMKQAGFTDVLIRKGAHFECSAVRPV